MPMLTPVDTMVAAAQQLTTALQKDKPQENENHDALQRLSDLFTKIAQQRKQQQPGKHPCYAETEHTIQDPTTEESVAADDVTVVTSNRRKEEEAPKVEEAPVPRVEEPKGLIVACPAEAVVASSPPNPKVDTPTPNYVTDNEDEDENDEPPPRYRTWATMA